MVNDRSQMRLAHSSFIILYLPLIICLLSLALNKSIVKVKPCRLTLVRPLTFVRPLTVVRTLSI